MAQYECMDPLSALGLAGTVLQFIDFAYKLVSGSVEIYKSTGGLTAENEFLEVIAEDVRQRSDDIPDSSAFGSSNAGRRLQMLATKSKNIAQQILGIIEYLKRETGKPNKWHSFVDLVRSMRRGPELRMLIDRINKLQVQINSDLTYIIW